ncbi:MAG: hypothetical protein Q9195_002608 [Heterodermia aff. obscurata]
MRVACLQFAPELGKVQENIARANDLLKDLQPGSCDILVLPEMAFSGYNFPSADAIGPFLELRGEGPSGAWAKEVAARLQCIVTIGYPEITPAPYLAQDVGNHGIPPSISYNSTITISPKGDTLAHYRKTHLYYTDETWAQASATKWLTVELPLDLSPSLSSTNNGLEHGVHSKSTRTSFGICMDLNPHRFEASWTLYELATYALNSNTELLLLSMAWLTHKTSTELDESAADPDIETLSYWIERIVPLVNNKERRVIVVFANRCGQEPLDARYAGSSWIGLVGLGKVDIWDIAGRAQETLLCIDTNQDPEYQLRTSQNGVPLSTTG